MPGQKLPHGHPQGRVHHAQGHARPHSSKPGHGHIDQHTTAPAHLHGMSGDHHSRGRGQHHPGEIANEPCCDVWGESKDDEWCFCIVDWGFTLLCFSFFGVCVRIPCHPRHKGYSEQDNLLCDVVSWCF